MVRSASARRHAAVLGALAIVALATAGSAHAATTTTRSGGELLVTATGGRVNDVTVTLAGTTFTVTDAGDTVLAGTDCVPADPHTVRCAGAGVTRVIVSLGDLDDRAAHAAPTAVSLRGGTGNDDLSAAGAAVGSGLEGGSGRDLLTGGAAGDTLDGGSGADHLRGGGGRDTAWYLGRTAPITVDLDDVADDGESGEADNVRGDVESVLGGAGADTLTGSAADNRLSGSAGDDVLRGGGGADFLYGNGGRDVLDGGAGPDALEGGIDRDRADYSARTTSVVVDIDGVADDGGSGENDNVALDVEEVYGGSRSDRLTGSAAGDTLVGGAGNDTLFGLGGDDVLDTFDGVFGNDYLSGGAGFDLCDFDDGDRAFGCG